MKSPNRSTLLALALAANLCAGSPSRAEGLYAQSGRHVVAEPPIKQSLAIRCR